MGKLRHYISPLVIKKKQLATQRVGRQLLTVYLLIIALQSAQLP